MFLRLALRSLVCAALAFPCTAPVLAGPGGTVAGAVSSVGGGPVAGARILLDGPYHLVASSARDGRYSLSPVPPGTYSATVSAARFGRPAAVTIVVRDGAVTTLSFALARSDSSLITIGRVSTNGGDSVSTSSSTSSTLNAQEFADQGYTRLSDVLEEDDMATVVHPAGGGGTVLPTAVSLRGPDPADTLIEIDGHAVNNGNTGDFDLSMLDPADFASIELVRGISPSSLAGPNTIDGAINLRTIEPTLQQHGLLRLNGGSFSSLGGTLQSTGTFDNRLGYALSLHRQGTAGEVNESVFDVPSRTVQQVGSGISASSMLGKLRYAFGNAGAGYAEISVRDQSEFRDLSAALSAYPGAGLVAGGGLAEAATAEPTAPPGLPGVLSYAGTAARSHNAGYGLDVSLPLGNPGPAGVAATTLLLRHYTSLVDQSIVGPGAETSAYLYNDRDVLSEETLQLDHRLSGGDLTLQYVDRSEALDTDFVVNRQSVNHHTLSDTSPAGISGLELGQTQRSLVLRYAYSPDPLLHLTVSTYYSNSTLFGAHVDPRAGLVLTPDAKTSVRFSLGTTYHSPELTELVVPKPLPVVVGGYVAVGNPKLEPDRATEYGLGFERILESGAHQTDASVDLYRVNLRTPAATRWTPLNPYCGPVSFGGDGQQCPLIYPVNAGDGIYRGVELGVRRKLGAYTSVRLGYALRSSYLTAIPGYIQDGSLVKGEQTLGLPLHKDSLSLICAPPRGLVYGANLVYEGAYNELNQPPFATLAGRLGFRFSSGYEVGLAGTNLTNVYDQRFTRSGLGVTYGGFGVAIPTDAYVLQGRAFTLTLARRF